jgi:FkbM family methyltransferase
MTDRYALVPRKVTAFTGRDFDVHWRYGTNDWDMYTSVMMEDGYRLQQFPFKPGMNAIDLGAHIGTVVLMLASMGVNVYAVEPSPENVTLMRSNVLANKLDSLVKIIPRAISSSAFKTLKLYYADPDDNIVNSVHHFVGWTVDGKPEKVREVIDVPTVTIEEIFRENNLDRCQFVKVDVEGAEWDALKDIPDEILERIDVIMGEVHYKKQGENVDHGSLLPLLRGFFVDASMAYEDYNPAHGPCHIAGGMAYFYYVRQDLPIPVKW